ncbi:MAG: YtxH domain-containing protein [Actinomycetota bacterium]|nr:YtxH domain-containing protein [Actinomycetota bacterium]
MSKLVILAAGAAGYVLGSKAGRERYDQIAARAQRLWSDPRVQQTASDAKYKAQEKAPEVRAKLDDTVSSVREKVSGSSDTSPGQL